MAGGPEDHFTDSRELYGLVEGDEWAHVEALDPDAGYWARGVEPPGGDCWFRGGVAVFTCAFRARP